MKKNKINNINKYYIIKILLFISLNSLLNIIPISKYNYLYYKINKYILICRKGILINKIKNISLTPKITALIPNYNSNLTIKSTLRSIENQKILDIEIIVVDDYSIDNSLEIIKSLQEEDKRIKIIKNHKNKGTLYSRSIGALKAKGKYIMSIDQDDIFTGDIFNICYKEATQYDIDIVEFSGLCLLERIIKMNTKPIIPYFLNFKKDKLIIKQPELSNFIYIKVNKGYKLIDAFIWGKCINSLIYKKALNLLGQEIYFQNVCWCEDRIVNYALFKVANSFKFINKFGIIRQRLSTSVGVFWRNEKKNKIINDELVNIMSLYKLSSYLNNTEIAFYEFSKFIYLNKKKLSKKQKDIIKNKLLNYKYISKKEKHKLFLFIK